jgi:Tol biopolymer transport system component
MGEVYRARDTELERDVAIKVLPEEVSQDVERLARFDREARVLAKLNHPHIAQIHGLEEDGGTRFLVLELVDGETLAARLERGAAGVEATLQIALQVARALEAAHERGVVHRDIKPANVMITREGDAKVLDFGIARPLEAPAGEGEADTRTVTTPPTRPGVVMGTPAYMSPEQLRGEGADRRSDIWAFGVTVWEMLTGSRLFNGASDSDILASVLKASPDWGELPAGTPPAIRRLLRRCLERDPQERLHDIADARLEIEEAITAPDWASTEQAGQPEPTFRDRVWAAWPAVLAAVVVGALLATTVWKLSEVRSTAPGPSMRLALNLPPGVAIIAGDYPVLALSPDGRWLVFAATDGATLRLFKRSLEQFNTTPIPGTEGGDNPFFSPDGRRVGFFAGGKLKKVPLDGGLPQVLADAPLPFGATWGADGTIVYIPRGTQGLWRVPATGGAPVEIASPLREQGELDLNWPEILPDGKAVLLTAFEGMTADTANICVLDLESRARKTLIENASFARYVPTGHLIFGHEGAVHVAPFDAERREVTGPPVPLPEPILYDSELGVPYLAFSAGGVLAFSPGGGAPRRRLMSVDLAGAERPLIDARRGFMYPRFSPDGERLAVTISEPGDTNVWVIDLATGAQTKLTQEGANVFPSWTPDGERVTYLSIRGGNDFSINWKRADGHGESEALVSQGEPGEILEPGSWSPDGKTLVFARYLPSQPENHRDIWIVDRDGDREPRPLFETGAREMGPAISPDGEWLAYVSWESGQAEIYVQPFPAGGERHQVSTAGGMKPVWSPDGRSIYYRAFEGGQWVRPILTAPVTTTPRVSRGSSTGALRRTF